MISDQHCSVPKSCPTVSAMRNRHEPLSAGPVLPLNFESGNSDPKLSTLHKLRGALAAAGVMFIDPDEKDGPGVRLRGTKGKR